MYELILKVGFTITLLGGVVVLHCCRGISQGNAMIIIFVLAIIMGMLLMW